MHSPPGASPDSRLAATAAYAVRALENAASPKPEEPSAFPIRMTHVAPTPRVCRRPSAAVVFAAPRARPAWMGGVRQPKPPLSDPAAASRFSRRGLRVSARRIRRIIVSSLSDSPSPFSPPYSLSPFIRRANHTVAGIPACWRSALSRPFIGCARPRNPAERAHRGCCSSPAT